MDSDQESEHDNEQFQLQRHMRAVPGVTASSPIDHMLLTVQDLLGPEHQEGNNKEPEHRKASVKPGPITWLGSRITTADPLTHFGIMQFPPPDVRLQFLRAFVKYVYPGFPCIDVGSVELLHGHCDHDTSSPLLMWAVLSAACPFVNGAALRGAGYATPIEAQEEMAKKAKLAYEMGVEGDPIREVQSLLLVSLWEGQGIGTKGVGYWLAHAIATAERFSLHIGEADNPVRGTRGLKKRIAWCLFIRDVQIALAQHQPFQMRDRKTWTALSPITMGDFPPASDQSAATVDPFSPFAGLQERLNSLFAHKATLYLVVADYLDCLYATLWTINERGDLSPTLSPRQGVPATELDSHRGSLETWFRELAGKVRPCVDNYSDLLLLSVTSLQIEYLFVVCAGVPRHNTENRVPAIPPSVLSGTEGIVALIRRLHSHGLSLSLPPSCVAVLLFTTKVYAAEVARVGAGDQSSSFSHYMVCVALLRAFNRVHPLPNVRNPLFSPGSTVTTYGS